MRIHIENGKRPIKLLIPNWLVTCRVTRKLVVFTLGGAKRPDGFPLTGEQLDVFLLKCKRIVKDFKGLRVLEVSSHDGERVIIEL